ncbi:hepatic and glial cell adhesion molecule-like [Heterodontus francisci]|uniref:hepatic and glial cell adhesion molecule-like n=1 Tax=Heterodontus francisci TaxID=7792 RepID=UPI00355C5C1A
MGMVREGGIEHIAIVQHAPLSMKVTKAPFYEHQINYNDQNGSIELLNLDLADGGTYELTCDAKDANKSILFTHVVEIYEILQQPLITQDIVYELSAIYLNCFVHNEEMVTVRWLKEDNPIQSDETYKLSNDNRTLIVNIQPLMNCKLYTCVVKNKVNQKESSHFLIVDGLLLLHKISFVTSVIAVFSTTTSFVVEGFIIFFSLKTYRVHKRHVELTAVFMFFQMLSFTFLLIAALFCIFDSASVPVSKGRTKFSPKFVGGLNSRAGFYVATCKYRGSR